MSYQDEKQDASLAENEQEVQAFIKLLTAHHTRIYAYILSLVGNVGHAEDIMQETSYMMWTKFSEFEIGSNFDAWAKRIAYYRVLEYRRKEKQNASMLFSDETLAQLHQGASEALHENDIEDYKTTLSNCIQKLDPKDRDLLDMKYQKNMTVKTISELLNQTIQNVYYHLVKVRNSLRNCMKRNMSI